MKKPGLSYGMVPMMADVLIIGLRPEDFDRYQRMVKGGFQSMHMGWNYVANPGYTFEEVIDKFLPSRPDLDIVYVCNEVDRLEVRLQEKLTELAVALAKHSAEPWVALSIDLERYLPIFASVGVISKCAMIETLAADRHNEKRRLFETA